MEEHQPLPHCSQRIARKPPLLPEAIPILSKQSHLTESSTSRTSSSSSKLPKASILASTETRVTPSIFGTSISDGEISQLLEDISIDPSETVTEIVQHQVDAQLEVAQQEITFEPELVQLEVNPEPILVQIEVTSKPEVVQEPLCETFVHLPEHLDFEFEHPKWLFYQRMIN